MKALAIDGYSLDNVSFVDVGEPEPGPGQVRVRIDAAALNHLDLWTVSGALKIEHDFPHVLGADGAGVVDAVGDGVRGLSTGTQVVVNPAISCGACEFCMAGEQSLCVRFKMLGEHLPGTFAEKVVVPATNVFPFPSHLSAAEASGLGVTFVTAYRMLFTRGRLRPGEWLLITGIGGGLAVALLQLARPVAGRIIVTSSSQAKIERALEMGAEAGVDYTADDALQKLRGLTHKRGFDLAVDSAGGDALAGTLRVLRKGGRVVSAGATSAASAEIDVRRLFWNQLEIIGSTMGSHSDFSEMLRMVTGANIRPHVDRSFPLSEGRQALSYLEGGDRFGKVVLDVGDIQ